MRRLLYIFPLLIAGVAASAFRPQGDAIPTLQALEAAADSGVPEAMYRLSALFERGYDSIPADSARSMRLLAGAAEKGYLPACNYLGYRLMQLGRSKEGLEWIERAAVAGDAKAQSNLGFLLTEGKVVKRDPEKAVFWLRKGAENGSATAASMLGDLYRDGLGVACDTAAAAKCYLAAVDAGLADAAYKLEAMMAPRWAALPYADQLALALYFYPGRAPGVAIPILERLAHAEPPQVAGYGDAAGDSAGDSVDGAPDGSGAAEPGVNAGEVSARAAALLGDAYTRALGVPYDHDRSLLYYWRSAEQGYAPAQFVVAELLEIFPDALDSLTAAPPSAEELMQCAAEAGINSAKEATEALFSPLDTAVSGRSAAAATN
ncbi:MAG: sel1 repeat family protein [Muribaculaceae bacterium]|nr:sel1 repeat family protein [Muribaculaceae bacterium]MDE7081314.1 sel1 repeat family protein [Muribaculaceae bacterium]